MRLASQFQVLPQRTHPEMTISAHGGFLLLSILVNSSDEAHGNGGFDEAESSQIKESKCDARVTFQISDEVESHTSE